MTKPDPWAALRRHTAARIALGRTGDGLPTSRMLEFELAHAQARDAVHASLDTAHMVAALGKYSPVCLESDARTRSEYLQRPDRGRRLAEHSRHCLTRRSSDVAVVVADGLSARAVHENAPGIVQRLHELLAPLTFAPTAIVLNGRVAVGDEIAEGLGASAVVVLIGERPGLSAADSLGAYLTFAPKPGVTRDAQRNCVSNIRAAGLSVELAARRIAALVLMARRIRTSGVDLKEDDAVALFGGEAVASLPRTSLESDSRPPP